MTRNDAVTLIELPTIPDHRGYLTVAGELSDIPFRVRRVYWVYGVPAATSRGGHAHKVQTQLIVAVSGSVTISTFDGKDSKSFLLDTPSLGLLMSPGVWHTLDNFSPDAVCLVIASEAYDEDEYIREYSDYLKFKGISHS